MSDKANYKNMMQVALELQKELEQLNAGVVPPDDNPVLEEDITTNDFDVDNWDFFHNRNFSDEIIDDLRVNQKLYIEQMKQGEQQLEEAEPESLTAQEETETSKPEKQTDKTNETETYSQTEPDEVKISSDEQSQEIQAEETDVSETGENRDTRKQSHKNIFVDTVINDRGTKYNPDTNNKHVDVVQSDKPIADSFGGGNVDEIGAMKEKANKPKQQPKPKLFDNHKFMGGAILVVLVIVLCFVASQLLLKASDDKLMPKDTAPKYSASASLPSAIQESGNKAQIQEDETRAKAAVSFNDSQQETLQNENNPQMADADMPQQQANGTNVPQQGGQGSLSPESGGIEVKDDPIYQQRQALRQQYLELARQAYSSAPSVQGSWSDLKQQQAAHKNLGMQMNIPNNTTAAAAEHKYSPAAQAALAATPSNMSQHTGAGNSAAANSKQAFFDSNSSGKGYLKTTRTEKISPYTLPAGTMIPAALISGINSELPGNITASVTENVYDWHSAHVCLIPQGSRLFGTYSSSVSFGQKRLQVSWQRLIFPDGTTLSLEGMSGVDRRGYSGLKDKIYNHYTKMIVAAAMTTAFTIIPALVENQRNDNSISYGNSARDTAASQAAQALGNMGNKFFDKSLNVQPTLLIRPGKRFNIQVNADIPFYRAWGVYR